MFTRKKQPCHGLIGRAITVWMKARLQDPDHFQQAINGQPRQNSQYHDDRDTIDQCKSALRDLGRGCTGQVICPLQTNLLEGLVPFWG